MLWQWPLGSLVVWWALWALAVLAALGSAVAAAWSWWAQSALAARLAELELPKSVCTLNSALGRAKLRDSLLLAWADAKDLPEQFWVDFNLVYAEFDRCPPKVSLFFDFWGWGAALGYEALELKEGEPALFDLGLVIPYARIMRIGLEGRVEWRDGDDSLYDTLHMPTGKSERVLPKDRRTATARHRKRPRSREDNTDNFTATNKDAMKEKAKDTKKEKVKELKDKKEQQTSDVASDEGKISTATDAMLSVEGETGAPKPFATAKSEQPTGPAAKVEQPTGAEAKVEQPTGAEAKNEQPTGPKAKVEQPTEAKADPAPDKPASAADR